MKKIVIAVSMVLCVMLFCACGTKSDAAIADNVVQTPYTDLIVPEEFKGNVTTEVVSEDPYTLSFKASDGTELFTLYFEQETDDLLGTLELDDKNVTIYATFGDFDRESENYETYCAYQEGINTILEGLMDNENFIVGEAVTKEDNSTLDIETSVVTMKYPAKWKDKVQIDISEDSVKFSADGTPLFDLVFAECDGYLLGTYKDTPIYIVEYNVDNDEQASMQDDVNVILQYLMEDGNFVINY